MSAVRLAVFAGLAVSVVVAGACVVADPVAEIPTARATRPSIERASASPPPTGVLTYWPSRFVVPVRLSDARETFFATFFVDYDPATGSGYDGNLTSSPAAGATDPLRVLQIPITQPSASGCHTVEVVVARQFGDLRSATGISAHSPLDPTNDGDTITWFYNPTGDPSGCPVIDAGLLPEAGPDGAN